MFNKAEIIRQLDNDSQDIKTLELYLKHHGVCLYTKLPFDGVGTLYWAQIKTYTSSQHNPKKVWRIVYETPWDCKPLLECPAETRLRVCRQLPALVEAIAAQVPEPIAKPLNQPRRVYHDGRQKKTAVALMVAFLISIAPAYAGPVNSLKKGINWFTAPLRLGLDKVAIQIAKHGYWEESLVILLIEDLVELEVD